jgi:hypothetical protein
MNIFFTLITLVFLQDSIPLKPMDEFEVKLNFEFKERLRVDANRIELDLTPGEYERRKSTGPLPYLFCNVRVIKPADAEVRVRVVENGRKMVLNKKWDPSTVLKLELGFTDDIKDRISAYEYTVIYLDSKKEPVSKVVIFFQEDGTYLVNGQVRGKL